jgi:hypothetical protein
MRIDEAGETPALPIFHDLRVSRKLMSDCPEKFCPAQAVKPVVPILFFSFPSCTWERKIFAKAGLGHL